MTEDTGQSAFLAESRELLEEMEEALLQLENEAEDVDGELIGAIFRAAHTIKGTGGVFGFDQVEAFTHVVENVLDKVRDGEIDIESDLIAILLNCKDHMGILVEHAVAEMDLPEEVSAQSTQLLDALQQYLGQNELVVQNETTNASMDNGPISIEKHGPKVESDNWHISVRFSRDVLRYGMDPLSFLRYLTRLGDITHVETLTFFPEDLESLDAESCYIGLEIELSAAVNKWDIEKVFEFVKEECVLFILPPKDYINNYLALIETHQSEDMLGEILVKCGALTDNELEHLLKIQDNCKRQQGETHNYPKVGDIALENKVVHKEVIDAAIEQQEKIRNKIIGNAKTIRVDADKLDTLVNLVGEMVIAGASTNLIANSLGHDTLIESMSVMSRLVEEIRDSALKLRMVQIGETFNRFQRVVRDVSRELGKDIQLDISGGETELDKTVVEKIGDPLLHLVRNAIDHGIEPNETRNQLHKPAKGTVELNAYHDSGSIVIEVSDDGKGLDKEKLLAKAIEKEIISPSQTLSEQEIYRLIFEPGFSTSEQVTNLSGRGVGMDVVRRNIEALRGSVDIESELGKGTTIRIRLPLTLAIIDGFLVGVGDSSYVIPLDMINECVEVGEIDSLKHHKQNHINLRGEVLPLLYLRDHFRVSGKDTGRENIVVVQFGNMKAGLVVDSLMGEFQTVIKPLGKIFRQLKGVSGSTILGSGEVAIILDVPGLVQQVSDVSAHLMAQSAHEQQSMNIH